MLMFINKHIHCLSNLPTCILSKVSEIAFGTGKLTTKACMAADCQRTMFTIALSKVSVSRPLDQILQFMLVKQITSYQTETS